MPRVKIGPALPDREKLDAEIARLRDLDVGQLRSRWHTVFGRPAPAHLARHLLFRSLAYRLQADRLGDLDRESQRLPAFLTAPVCPCSPHSLRVFKYVESTQARNLDVEFLAVRQRRTDLHPRHGSQAGRRWGWAEAVLPRSALAIW